MEIHAEIKFKKIKEEIIMIKSENKKCSPVLFSFHTLFLQIAGETRTKIVAGFGDRDDNLDDLNR